jgi:lipopolysaccharide/colanic/teichoic acid biosynthesis glycosyltransferase
MKLPTIAATYRSSWNRIRLQLGVGLLLAVFLPYIVRTFIDPQVEDPTSLNNSLIGTLAGLTMGYFGFRRMSFYPGVRVAYSILPAFAASYGIVLMLFFLARLDYSRLHFTASFLICLAWFYAVYFRIRRQRLSVGVLPFGAVESVYNTPELHCVTISDLNQDLSGLNGVVADLRADIPDEWERFLADQALNEVLVMHAKQVVESMTGRVEIEHLSENTFGSLIPGIVYAKVKRLADFVSALVALPFVALVLIPAAIAIKLDSTGPIFFRQRRMGYRGKRFTIVKLRTMRIVEGTDTDARSSAMTLDNDQRITRVGKFLRHYRIDELPQLLNVLRGDMSWIGPRPEAVELSLWYERELPFYRYRHIVRPGITGWAQVRQGHVAEVDEVLGKLHYDFYYIKHFSFWLDLLIVARTIRTILSGFGAR